MNARTFSQNLRKRGKSHHLYCLCITPVYHICCRSYGGVAQSGGVSYIQTLGHSRDNITFSINIITGHRELQ